MTIYRYLKRKFNTLYIEEVPQMKKADSCLYHCHKAYHNLMRSKGRVANKEAALDDFDFWFGDYYKIDGDLPNVFGQYIHICNTEIPNIANFMDIQGEVCFTDLGANQLIRSNNKPLIGIIVEAIPEQSYSYDCWSEINSKGLRSATAESFDCVNADRPEYWIIPAKSKIVGIAYNKYVSDTILGNLIKQINENRIIYTVPFNAINS